MAMRWVVAILLVGLSARGDEWCPFEDLRRKPAPHEIDEAVLRLRDGVDQVEKYIKAREPSMTIYIEALKRVEIRKQAVAAKLGVSVEKLQFPKIARELGTYVGWNKKIPESYWNEHFDEIAAMEFLRSADDKAAPYLKGADGILSEDGEVQKIPPGSLAQIRLRLAARLALGLKIDRKWREKQLEPLIRSLLYATKGAVDRVKHLETIRQSIEDHGRQLAARLRLPFDSLPFKEISLQELARRVPYALRSGALPPNDDRFDTFSMALLTRGKGFPPEKLREAQGRADAWISRRMKEIAEKGPPADPPFSIETLAAIRDLVIMQMLRSRAQDDIPYRSEFEEFLRTDFYEYVYQLGDHSDDPTRRAPLTPAEFEFPFMFFEDSE